LVGNESPTVTTDTGDQYNADPSGGINYLRKKLLQPAAPLIYASKGLGTLRVNVQQQTLNLGFDLEWGPKPEILSLKHLAAERAALVTWGCTCRTLFCDDFTDRD